MHEPRYKTSRVERFLRYVEVGTQSRDVAPSLPSSEGQLELRWLLAGELRDLRQSEVGSEQHGYMSASIRERSTPAIGFIAHVDTALELLGAGV